MGVGDIITMQRHKPFDFIDNASVLVTVPCVANTGC